VPETLRTIVSRSCRCAAAVSLQGARLLLIAAALLSWPGDGGALADDLPSRDVHALFEKAEAEGRVGIAQKSTPVDARPAKPGEVVVTFITGEGKETQSRPADAGDMVVRNRCLETGNEEYLVKAATFAERYAGPISTPDPGGWREYRPQAPALRYFVVGRAEGSFTFTAPWGEAMVARPGDAIVRNPVKPTETYRVAVASFACTYKIISAPRR